MRSERPYGQASCQGESACSRKEHPDNVCPPPRFFALRVPVMCVLGFSLYMGWVFCLFWSPALFSDVVFDDVSIHTMRLVMTVSMLAAYIAFGLFARFLALRGGETTLRIVSLVCCPLSCVVGLLPQGLGFFWCFVFWAASGIGTSALLLVWSKKLVGLNRKQVIFTASSAFLVGSFLFVATAFMPAIAALPSIAFLPVASVTVACLDLSPTLSFAYGEKDISKVEAERDAVSGCSVSPEAENTKSHDGLSGGSQRATFTRTVLLGFTYSVGIGFVGSCATVQTYYPASVYVIAAGNACAAVFAVTFLVRHSRNMSVVVVEVFLPVMLVCIFAFSFVGQTGQLVCIVVMLALLACHDIVDIESVSKSSRLFEENYVRTFAVGRTLNGLGCSLGWATGILLNFLPDIDAAGRLFVCFALVVFLVITTSFALFYPEPSFYAGESCENSSSIPQKMDIAIYAKTTGGLEAKVSSVAVRYSLTSRQEEVLLCLAQGRNASYIAQRFTISIHTAKSHIYNIYNKLGIHSQQELLDIVDAEGLTASAADQRPIANVDQ